MWRVRVATPPSHRVAVWERRADPVGAICAIARGCSQEKRERPSQRGIARAIHAYTSERGSKELSARSDGRLFMAHQGFIGNVALSIAAAAIGLVGCGGTSAEGGNQPLPAMGTGGAPTGTGA